MKTDTKEAAITVTPVAAGKLQDLIEERGDLDCGLRVFVAGAGCSGLQYGMGLESEPRETDTIFESEGIKIIIDPNSLAYMSGSQIDYVDNAMGSGFAIHNPNAVSACGAGGCSGC